MAKHTAKATRKFEKSKLQGVLDRRKEGAKVKQRHRLQDKKKTARKLRAADQDDASSPLRQNQTQAPASSSEKTKALQDMTVDEFFAGGFQVPSVPKVSSGKKAKSAGQREKTLDKSKASSTRPSVTKAKSQQQREASMLGFESDGDDDDLLDLQPVEDSEGDDQSMSDADEHRENLDALAEKDPEFYKYLQDNDAELLDFQPSIALPAEISTEQDSDKKQSKKRKRPDANAAASEDAVVDVDVEAEEQGDADAMMVTDAMLDKWESALRDQQSLRATRELLLAFRAAAHANDGAERGYKYAVSSPDIYHRILMVTLQRLPAVLEHHLPVRESAGGRIRVPTETKKFQTLSSLLNPHAAAICHLLENLSGTATLKLTLDALEPLLPYLLSFKKTLKILIKVLVEIWADHAHAEATRVNAFILIRRMAVLGDPSLREIILKLTYQGLVRVSRETNYRTLAGINLMKNTAAELWGLDPNLGYTTGFTLIRQLAILLRPAINRPTKDSPQVILNWQYTHSIDFWSRVLAMHCPDAYPPHPTKALPPLQPLVYPLVQIALGALRLVPSPLLFPHRFHLVQALLRLSRATGVYIPLAPALIEVLQSPELRRAPKPSTLKPLDFATTLRAPKSYLHTRVYQDGLGTQVVELLAECFGVWASNIAFPELLVAPTVWMKRWLRQVSTTSDRRSGGKGSKHAAGAGNQNMKLNSAVQLLLRTLRAQAAYVEQRRRQVDFAPNDRAAVDGFLRDVAFAEMPLGAYILTLRRQNAERQQALDQGRQVESDRRERSRDAEGKKKSNTKGKARVASETSDEESNSGQDQDSEEELDDDLEGEEDSG